MNVALDPDVGTCRYAGSQGGFEVVMRHEQLDPLDRDRPGRWILLYSIDGCAPCDALSEALLGSEMATKVVVSKLRKGDVSARSAHLRQSVRSYPTVLLVEAGQEISRIEGRTMIAGSVDLTEFRAFVQGV